MMRGLQIMPEQAGKLGLIWNAWREFITSQCNWMLNPVSSDAAKENHQVRTNKTSYGSSNNATRFALRLESLAPIGRNNNTLATISNQLFWQRLCEI